MIGSEMVVEEAQEEMQEAASKAPLLQPPWPKGCDRLAACWSLGASKGQQQRTGQLWFPANTPQDIFLGSAELERRGASRSGRIDPWGESCCSRNAGIPTLRDGDVRQSQSAATLAGCEDFELADLLRSSPPTLFFVASVLLGRELCGCAAGCRRFCSCLVLSFATAPAAAPSAMDAV